MPGETARHSLLEMRNISKTFAGIKALRGVSLDLRAGEVHSLMGENGAGKSTLMKILAGAYIPDPGSEILINGIPVQIHGPMAAKALGISIIYQELALSPNLSVAENIYLGRELRRAGFVDRQAMIAQSDNVLRRLGAPFKASALVRDLSIAERQLVEIARAIHANSRILVMDEPTTTLSERETDKLFGIVRQLRDDGLAIVYISHRMNEVYALSDRVSVLRDGSYVGTLERDAIRPETVVLMMVGRDLSSFYRKEHDARGSRGKVILSVRNIGDGRRVFDSSFDLHEGEVLGIAGLVGAGRTELARLIYGADACLSGTLTLDGQPCAIKSPIDAIRSGIVYLTEDRKQLGLFLDMSIDENINLGVIGRDAYPGGFLNPKRARERAAQAIQSMAIRAPSAFVPVGALSGGNQQKVLLSRLLETKPRVLILDEPTRGVDIGAKSEIYRLIDDLAKAGVGVIVISSELPEIIGICDRVLVMREGRIAGEVGGPDALPVTQENIIAIATSATAIAA
ncbi:D-xylose ABC transporter ATP-binding protein [Microvirga sp. KLBC 81]|uniref:sugar ABC transporter ATP-binding protein n=1 Tax=Microvirga sp. KLBC 81 TaxID=1862707 RepID=UPI000D517F24|nr:sugar ABC transporter ATP-binding protein [Microvirga sp. KLBC 81]PVE20494.1 D-xylose ABC transporter ATP-binding protein [Microvirga sp. KLBC 81]